MLAYPQLDPKPQGGGSTVQSPRVLGQWLQRALDAGFLEEGSFPPDGSV